MKHTVTANYRTRREIMCSPKNVKSATRAKSTATDAAATAATAKAPAVEGGVSKQVVCGLSGAEEKEQHALASGGVADLNDVREGLDNGVEKDSDSANDLDPADNLELDTECDSHLDSEDESDQENDPDVLKETPLDMEEAMMWEMEDNADFGEEGELVSDWDRSNTRKADRPSGSNTKNLAKSSGKQSGGRKLAKFRGDDDGHGRGRDRDGGWRDNSREMLHRRRESRGGGRGQRGRGRGDAGRGSGPGRGPAREAFGERGDGGGLQQGGGPRGFPGRGNWNWGRGGGREDGGSGRGGGRGVGRTPPPVRSIPYKWGMPTGAVQGTQALPRVQQLSWDSKANIAAAVPAEGEQGGGGAAVGGGFGGGATAAGNGQHQGAASPRAPPVVDRTGWTSASAGLADRSRMPPKVMTPSAPGKPAARPLGQGADRGGAVHE